MDCCSMGTKHERNKTWLLFVLLLSFALVLCACKSSTVSTDLGSKKDEHQALTSSKTVDDYDEYDDEDSYEIIDIDELTISELEDYADNSEIVEAWLWSHDADDYMEWEYVDSTAIEEVGYAPWPFEVLVIRFLENSDPLYYYYEVPEDVYNDLIDAESIGGYYNRHIKGQYECERFD